MNKKSVIISVVLLIVLAAALYAYKEYQRQPADLASNKPSFTITADELLNEFERDSSAAAKKYIDKTISINGTVTAIDTTGVITIGKSGEMSSIQCTLDQRHASDINLVKVGSTATIKGLCNGYQSDELLGTDVKMNYCTIENQGK